MSTPDVAALCVKLDALQRQRKFYISLRNAQANRGAALVRTVMGVPREATDAISADEIARLKKAALAIAAGQIPSGFEYVCAQVEGPVRALLAALEPLDAARHAIELEMGRAARKLPVTTWAKGVRGLGELALAVILAETGDLSNYASEAKVWRRLGLAPFKGRAMSNWKSAFGRMGDDALSSDEWTACKYSPRRRAEIYACVGDPLFRGQTAAKDGSRPAGRYRQVYDARRAHTAVTHPEMPMKGGQNPPEPFWTKKHQHDDAVRIMTKSLISDLWSEWRRAIAVVADEPNVPVPAANTLLAETHLAHIMSAQDLAIREVA